MFVQRQRERILVYTVCKAPDVLAGRSSAVLMNEFEFNGRFAVSLLNIYSIASAAGVTILNVLKCISTIFKMPCTLALNEVNRTGVQIINISFIGKLLANPFKMKMEPIEYILFFSKQI